MVVTLTTHEGGAHPDRLTTLHIFDPALLTQTWDEAERLAEANPGVVVAFPRERSFTWSLVARQMEDGADIIDLDAAREAR